MSMNDSETVALIGDYRLQYRKYGLTMNITLDNTFERVFHVFRCLTLLRGFHCLFCLHFQDLDKAKNGLMSDSQMFQKVESG